MFFGYDDRPMHRLRLTFAFFVHVLRDILGTALLRWRTGYRRVVHGESIATVGVDVFPFFEKMTGVGWYEWNLLAALDQRDDGLRYNLYAHTFLAPDEPAPVAMPGRRRMRLRVHQMPEGFLLPIRPTLIFLRWVVEPVLRFLDGNHVFFAPNFFVPRRQLPFAPRVVATVHDLAFKAMPETVAEETRAELEKNLLKTLVRCKKLIAVSEATAGDIVEYLGVERLNIRVIHEGLDPDFGEGAVGECSLRLPERYLLFLSTLEPRKNVVNVIRAFNLAAEWGYIGDLVLAGRWGWNTSEIRAALEGSPFKDRILHLDYVERRDLAGLYRRADAFLFPSWLEGFGLPILEAMACGTPVVTSGCSAMPEVAGPGAVYVEPDSAHSIATAILALVNNPDHRRRLSEAGRKRAQRFSWDEAAAATAQVLRGAAGLKITAPDEYRV